MPPPAATICSLPLPTALKSSGNSFRQAVKRNLPQRHDALRTFCCAPPAGRMLLVTLGLTNQSRRSSLVVIVREVPFSLLDAPYKRTSAQDYRLIQPLHRLVPLAPSLAAQSRGDKDELAQNGKTWLASTEQRQPVVEATGRALAAGHLPRPACLRTFGMNGGWLGLGELSH
jgi:hypothetical protein